jgi:hypothetical protein
MRVKFRRGKQLIAVMLAVMMHQSNSAQILPTRVEVVSTQEDLAKVVRDICTLSFSLVVSDLQPALDREPQLKGVNTKVLFEADPQYRARADFQDKRVLISRGFCYHNWLINWAQQLAIATGLQAKIPSYIEYLSNYTLQLEQTGEPWKVEAFEKFANIDLAKIPAENLTLAQSSAISTMRGILAFAIAHEFGHLALNHQPAANILPTEARKQEYAADLYALRLLSSVRTLQYDYTTFGSLFGVSLNTLAAREIGRSFSRSNSHPPTHCRQALLDREGRWLETIASNPVDKEKFERSMGRSMSELIHMRNTTIKSCPTP